MEPFRDEADHSGLLLKQSRRDQSWLVSLGYIVKRIWYRRRSRSLSIKRWEKTRDHTLETEITSREEY